MAVYKVPQDVEAEDKLIGPFSFRQFIYLIVAALGIFLAWALAQIFIGLFILPMPIVIAFLALALPLRKDQPMETYLIAMIKFFFKPRRRLWDPEGTISMVRITAPRLADGPELKGFGSDEASQRLAYLAQVVDTRGWSTRGATSASDSLTDIFVAEASHAVDVLDEGSGVAQAFNQRISASDDARMQAARAQMQAALTQTVNPAPAAPVAQPQTDPVATQPTENIHFDPYPNAMHQRVLSPAMDPHSQVPADSARTDAVTDSSSQNPENSVTSSVNGVSPDILRLANNNDLSISAIANEAHRLKDTDNEVVVSLR